MQRWMGTGDEGDSFQSDSKVWEVVSFPEVYGIHK